MGQRYKLPVAVHLLLLREDKILLLRRFNTGYEDGNYSVIAGHIDEGEDFISAVVREAEEEVGVIIDYHELLPVQVMHRKKDHEERIDYFLVAEKWKGKIMNQEPNKCDELKWFLIGDLPHNTIPYIKFGIESYLRGDKFTLFGWD